MLIHIVLFRPRASIDRAARRALAESLLEARRSIPAIRGFRIGRRLVGGPEYGHAADLPYCALIEFDDEAGLQAYLQHPAHERLGTLFRETTEAAIVCDFRVSNAEEALSLIEDEPS